MNEIEKLVADVIAARMAEATATLEQMGLPLPAILAGYETASRELRERIEGPTPTMPKA